MALDGEAIDDKSSLIQILTWFLFIVGVFSICARGASKLMMSILLSWDDWFILAAQVVLLFQAIVLSNAASHGLGKPLSIDHRNETESAIVESSLKGEYAYVPLFILALALIKSSLFLFIRHLTPHNFHQRLNLAIGVLIGLWLASGVLVSIFQCSLPRPWDYIDGGNCVDRKAWWSYVAGLNMGTELAFVFLYIFIFRKLHTSLARKASVLAIFSTRLLVIGAAIVQLMSVRALSLTPGLPYNNWAPIIYNQVVACFSITTACLPYLRPFMQSIELGVIQVDENEGGVELSQRPRRTGEGTGNSSGGPRGARSPGFFKQLSQLSHPATIYHRSPDSSGDQDEDSRRNHTDCA